MMRGIPPVVRMNQSTPLRRTANRHARQMGKSTLSKRDLGIHTPSRKVSRHNRSRTRQELGNDMLDEAFGFGPEAAKRRQSEYLSSDRRMRAPWWQRLSGR